MSVEMQERMERLKEHFPPPMYDVVLVANEREIWVVNTRNHAVAEIGRDDFMLDPEGPAELEYVREALA